MFSLLVFLFTVIPAIEIFLLFEIGGAIGGVNTLVVVIITGIIGASLAKSQGLHILQKLQTELSTGAIPTNSILHGLLVFGGGLLLLTPGFLTDILGLSMVLPGPRHLLISALKKYFENAIKSGKTQFHFYGQNSHSSFYHFSKGSPFDQNPKQEFDNSPRKVDENTFEADFTKK